MNNFGYCLGLFILGVFGGFLTLGIWVARSYGL